VDISILFYLKIKTLGWFLPEFSGIVPPQINKKVLTLYIKLSAKNALFYIFL